MTLTFAGTVRVPGEPRTSTPRTTWRSSSTIRSSSAISGSRPSPSTRARWRRGTGSGEIGLDAEHDLVSQKTQVELVQPLILGEAQTPRFRDTNLDAIWVEDAVDSYGGVLVDAKGHVRALWASFLDQASGERGFYGLPLSFVMPVVTPLLRGEPVVYRTLGVELAPISLAQARDRGLSDDRVRELLAHDPEGRRILEVQRVHGLSPAKGVIRDTDLVIAIDGRPVTSPTELEVLQQKEKLVFTVLRDEQELTIDVPTLELPGRGVDRIVSWAGLVLHEPHDDVSAQQGIDARGVYIAWLWFGTPAARYGIRPTRRIVKVDEVDTPDLDSFLAAVATRGDREPVRLTLEKLDGSEMVATLKLDSQYWPTEVIELVDGQWVRRQAPGELARMR